MPVELFARQQETSALVGQNHTIASYLIDNRSVIGAFAFAILRHVDEDKPFGGVFAKHMNVEVQFGQG